MGVVQAKIQTVEDIYRASVAGRGSALGWISGFGRSRCPAGGPARGLPPGPPPGTRAIRTGTGAITNKIISAQAAAAGSRLPAGCSRTTAAVFFRFVRIRSAPSATAAAMPAAGRLAPRCGRLPARGSPTQRSREPGVTRNGKLAILRKDVNPLRYIQCCISLMGGHAYLLSMCEVYACARANGLSRDPHSL